MDYNKLRALLLRRFSMPKERSIRGILRSFTIAEKAVFYFFVSVFLLSGAALLWKVNNAFLVEVPIRGGTLTEGVVGNPRFINPVLAISEADKNLVSLLYSGLVRVTPEGKIENDLAEEVTISDDRRTYTVRLHQNARFHDGTPVTADDVIFTIQKITDPSIKSPKRGNWDGVAVEKIDEKTVSFTLKQAYTPFIYNLTLGILPKHIWKNVSNDEFSFSQFNTLPIGSGPYKVERVERNSGGIPNLYRLAPFENISDKAPFIKNLVFKFYPGETALIEAFSAREVESISGVSPEKTLELQTNNSRIISSPLPRVFAVFFNQSQSKALLNKEARQALNLTSPRKKIVEEILGGYATAITGPMPAGIYSWTSMKENSLTPDEELEIARALLAKAGWRANPETGILEKKSASGTMSLSFSISTSDAPELQRVASELATRWRELGAKVEVLVFETGDLNQNVIRPRNFDALLFGEVVGRDADLYPFWHSSQRTDPGINIALYANSRADKYLDDARSAAEPEAIEKNYKAFAKELETDVPAVFLYTPNFLYVMPEKIKAVNLGSLTVSQDRFLSITDWYIETDKVWKIFAK
ncbi:MAG: Extracellular solute-binding protein family 5 [Candidatus Yanofskybacteria bacterium GW2011_GWA1_48_10]|uniref:Extracellular solute-binding protein family 5 n=1 Tax=Candidatus Yanofskybacteria bacterium GW2011_GWA1_48_10 TaxID=1619022 RepID=A0A0G1U581_9BACT|nr:MAG: Extracellular solute-binding protein family 5 [Candidatus Yanofskybacteria bacterium GW2011_GWA1_48_10]